MGAPQRTPSKPCYISVNKDGIQEETTWKEYDRNPKTVGAAED
jgi:hypothetical protein